MLLLQRSTAWRATFGWSGPARSESNEATKTHLCTSFQHKVAKKKLQQSISIHFHDLFDFDRSAQDNQSFFAKICWIYLFDPAFHMELLLSCNRVRGHFAFVGYWNTVTQVQILPGPRDALEAFQHLIHTVSRWNLRLFERWGPQKKIS